MKIETREPFCDIDKRSARVVLESQSPNGRRLNVTPLILTLVLVWVLAQAGFSTLTSAQMTIPLSTIQKGYSSGVYTSLQTVIRTQPDWETFWKRYFSAGVTPLSPPRVDFSTEMVAGVFLGQKSTGGYEVEITRAEQTESALRVYYREKSPPGGAVVIQVLSQPYHLVRLPQYDAPVLFQREKP